MSFHGFSSYVFPKSALVFLNPILYFAILLFQVYPSTLSHFTNHLQWEGRSNQ